MDAHWITPFPVGPVPEGVKRLVDEGGYSKYESRLMLATSPTRYGSAVVDTYSGWTFEVLDDQPCGAGCRCAASARWLPDVERVSTDG